MLIEDKFIDCRPRQEICLSVLVSPHSVVTARIFLRFKFTDALSWLFTCMSRSRMCWTSTKPHELMASIGKKLLILCKYVHVLSQRQPQCENGHLPLSLGIQYARNIVFPYRPTEFYFLFIFLSYLLNSVINFDIDTQLLGAIFWTFLWKFIHGFLVHNCSDIWCSTRMYIRLSKNSRNLDTCRNFTTLILLGFVEKVVLYLSKART